MLRSPDWFPLSESYKYRNVCGIYLIRNKIDGKEYVGMSVNIGARLGKHRTGDPSRSYLYKALHLHGVECFESCILIRCSRNLLSTLEVWTIRNRRSLAPLGYNLTTGGEGIQGFKHRAETKAAIGLANSGKVRSDDVRAILSLRGLGRIAKDSTKQKISAAHKGKTISKQAIEALRARNTGKKHSEATKRKMSEARTGVKLSDAHKQKLLEAWKVREMSKEHKEKLLLANLGRPCSDKTRLAVAQANSVAVFVWLADCLVPKLFDSIKEASVALAVADRTVYTWLKIGHNPKRTVAICYA